MNKLIVGNLKMNLSSPFERDRYLEMTKKELAGRKLGKTEVVLCPAYIHLESFRKSLPNKIKIGALNMLWEEKGAYTGEVSGTMLKNYGIEYVIIGHSERRRYFCEGDEEANMKMLSALKLGLKPILCVGETKVEKENNQTMKVVASQLRSALLNVRRAKVENISITYEPVWAVGSDVFPTSHEIMEAKVLIRKILVEMFGKKYAGLVRIIYGGSVNAKMTKQVCLDPEMDGVLVGRESLNPHELIKIAEIISNT